MYGARRGGPYLYIQHSGGRDRHTDLCEFQARQSYLVKTLNECWRCSYAEPRVYKALTSRAAKKKKKKTKNTEIINEGWDE